MGEIFDIEFETITGEATSLKQLNGKEFLIVNVAVSYTHLRAHET